MNDTRSQVAATAYLSVQVPRSINIPYRPKRTPVLVESIDSDFRLQISADGRSIAVPAGLIYVTAKPRHAAPVTVAILLEAGQVHNYRFGEQLFRENVPSSFGLTASSRALPGKSGTIYIRMLEGPRNEPTPLTHIISSGSCDGDLLIVFRGIPSTPVIAEIASIGRSRTYLCLSPTLGPGRLYSSVSLSLERQQTAAILTASHVNAELAAAWRSAVAGDYRRALELVESHLQAFLEHESIDPVTGAGVGYILIRAGEWNQLGNVVTKLLNFRSVSADSLVIGSEWFGHEGCHLSALNLLRQLPEAGVPMFTDGYSLSVARLSAYITFPYVDGGHAGHTPRGKTTSKARSAEERSLDGLHAGQRLMSWNCSEARHVHKFLIRNIEDIDWSSYVLRFTRVRATLPNIMASLLDWLSTHLWAEWTAVEWTVPCEKQD